MLQRFTIHRLFSIPVALPFLLGGLLLHAQPAGVVPGGYIHTYPNSATIERGTTLQLRAAVMNPVGFELPNRKVTWKSGKSSVASVDSSGLVTAVSAGSVTISAKSGAAEGSVNLIVTGGMAPPLNTAPVVTITAPADGSVFPQSTPITFTGTANDAQQGNLSGTIVWTSALAADPNGVQTTIGTGASIVSSLLAPGSYLVTASATDAGSLTGIAQIGITVQPPCEIRPALSPSTGEKLPQTLRVSAEGTVDTCSRPLQYFWDCGSFTSGVCNEYNVTANAPNNTNVVTFVDIKAFEDITIVLKVCVADSAECAAPIQRVYFGAVTSVDWVSP